MKQATIQKVFKELDDILDNGGKITSLTDEQREAIHFEFDNETDFNNWEFDATWSGLYKVNIADEIIKEFADVVRKAENWVIKNNIKNTKYWLDYDCLYVQGINPKNDKYLIKEYVKMYEENKADKIYQQEEKKRQQAENKLAKQQSKCANKATVIIEGKKYKLTEIK